MLLWRWRHLVVASAVGCAVVAVLAVLSPRLAGETEVVTVARAVPAGKVLEEADLTVTRVPRQLLPATALPRDPPVGARAAIALDVGVVLTPSMVAGELAGALRPGERLVQVPVSMGAGLAQVGAVVDVVAPQAVNALQEAAAGQQAALEAGEGGEGSEGSAAGTPTARAAVVCAGARVLLAEEADAGGRLALGRTGAGTMVTLVTLAVPEEAAPVIVTVATQGALGIVLSP